jgi:hypothetical protein
MKLTPPDGLAPETPRRLKARAPWRLALPLLSLAACRFGGPSGDATAYVGYPPDASGDDGAAMAPGADDSVSPGGDAQPSGADDTGPISSDDSTPPGDDAGNGDDGAAPGGDSEGGSCSPQVSVCDPVHNTGCIGQQCDVNPLTSATAPAGTCIFGPGASDASIPDGSLCYASAFTESCPAKTTCFNGACQQLCFCDPDCPSGQCCSKAGPPGFKVCGSCSP